MVSSFDGKHKYNFERSNSVSEIHFDDQEVHCSTKSEYLDDANTFLNELKSKNLAKAVFSRIKKVDVSVHPIVLFNRLCEVYPEAFVYLISSPLFGTWIGASPEILVEINSDKAKTMALAGTLKSNSEVFWSGKELKEQQYVTDYIETELKELGINEILINEREEFVAGPVKHLRTVFNFSTIGKSALEIANALHPTPAVCGFPRDKAIALIEKTERHERSLYAGFIGVVGEEQSVIYVNLRCAQLLESSVNLYVGGGLTADSDIEMEWEETENKARTMLNVIENISY